MSVKIYDLIRVKFGLVWFSVVDNNIGSCYSSSRDATGLHIKIAINNEQLNSNHFNNVKMNGNRRIEMISVGLIR